ncbi:carbohydrate ABC transporter permease [Paenibacillus sp. S150]|uniref:carbohydrate ABC transporter permease n=1 Tax=Paenibacillus sp. S150 TaxID=2749826 RepID=UPI001C55A927|nr:sugar ABC transporter permease [Paenibacillus sp. S150]MBW4082224.1 sugar ABC transporter permease [Paenibacillus sp. S150]
MVKKQHWILVSFVLPTLLFYLYFFIAPVGSTVYNSFFEWNGMSAKVFIALENYVTLLGDTIFYKSLLHSFYWVLLVLVIQIPLGFFLAYFLSAEVKGFKFLRTVYFIPVVTSTVAVTLVFSFIYDPNFGILNALLRSVGLEQWATAWLSNPSTAIHAVSLPFVWQNIGLMMVIIYAGLQSVPGEIIEAAQLDGVNAFQKIVHVIIPMVWSVILVCIVMGITFAFKSFDYVLLLTRGGPLHQTEVSGSYMYLQGFDKMNYGYGNAIAVTMMVVVLVLSVAINKMFKSKV